MTNDNDTNQAFNDAAGAAGPDRAAINEIRHRVPDYRESSPGLRAVEDVVIGRTDIHQPDTLHDFGSEALSMLDEISERILDRQAGDMFDFLRDPLNEASEMMGGFDIDSITNKISSLAGKGMGVVKRNPVALATGALAALFAGPVIGTIGLLGGGGAVALKEGKRAFGGKISAETPEQLEEYLREGISQFGPMVEKLKEAQGKIPELRQNVRELGEANLKSLYVVSVYIGAGKEILRRITEETLPQLEAEGDLDTAALLRESGEILSGRLTILDHARMASVMDVTLMGDLMRTINNNAETLASILENEIKIYRKSLAAGSNAVDVLRIQSVITDFRKQSEGNARRAVQATEQARKLSESGRIDSPERLLAICQNMETLTTGLEASVKALPAAEAQRKTLQIRAQKAVEGVVEAQVRHAQATAAVTALPAPSGTSNAPKLTYKP